MSKKDELENGNENDPLISDNKADKKDAVAGAGENTAKKSIFTRIKEFVRGKTFGEIVKYIFIKLGEYLKFAWVEFVVIAGAILLDLVSKGIVDATMEPGDSFSLIPKFLNFHYTQNTRAAFGSAFGLDKLLGDKGALIFLIVFTFIALVVFLAMMYAFRKKSWLGRISIAMIIGGAIGNLVDRIAFGYVRDFVEIEFFGLTIFGSQTFAIFNLADSFLVVGLILFAIFFIFKYNDKDTQTEKAEAGLTESAPDSPEDKSAADIKASVNADADSGAGGKSLGTGFEDAEKNIDDITEKLSKSPAGKSSGHARGSKADTAKNEDTPVIKEDDLARREEAIDTATGYEPEAKPGGSKPKAGKEEAQADDYE